MGDGTRTRQHAQDLRRTLAENVRFLRAKYKLSQEKLAGVCGLHRTYVGSVERCERNVTLGTLAAFATALGVSVPDLLTQKENLDA
jgi:transcriptional regulator with XRE-family HTH domain